MKTLEEELKDAVYVSRGKNLANVNSFSAVNTEVAKYLVKATVQEGQALTISAIKNRIAGVSISNQQLWGISLIYFYDKSMNEINHIRGVSGSLTTGDFNIKNTITTPEGCRYMVVDFCNNNGDPNLNTSVSNIQIEYGTEATEYEASIGTSLNIKEQGGLLEVFNIDKVQKNEELKLLTNGITYHKVGTDVEININNIDVDLNGNEIKTLGILPEDYRPSYNIFIPCYGYMAGVGTLILRVLIYNTGEVRIQNLTSSVLKVTNGSAFIKYGVL